MTINVGSLLCKYLIVDGKLVVREGIVEEHAGRCKMVNFGPDIEAEKIPRYKDLGRVWKGGETLWLAERNDELAKELFIDYWEDRISELKQEIDEANAVIKLIKKRGFKSTSKCFGDRSDSSDGGSGSAAKKKDRNKYMKEYYERQYKEGWDCSEYIDPEQYARRKITMLEKEMYIELSVEDIQHLKSLTTRGAIDAAVRMIINRAW